MIHRFAFPTTIHFGAGARKLVADHLKTHNVARPLVVTDRALSALPVFKAFLRELPGLDVAVFAEIWGNPTRSQVHAGKAAYHAHRADGVIGIGGGAALDVAKAIALIACHEGDILEYAWDHPAVRPIENPLPYFIALPTTAGTGSEVGRSSVISDDATHIVRGRPDRAVVGRPFRIRFRESSRGLFPELNQFTPELRTRRATRLSIWRGAGGVHIGGFHFLVPQSEVHDLPTSEGQFDVAVDPGWLRHCS